MLFRSNVGLANASVTGSLYTGALAGINFGTITNSYATGGVTGGGYIGGLVGDNVGSIDNSYADVSVDGELIVGGLAGSNVGHITNSYAMGNVTGSGNNCAGGLVGKNDNYSGVATITNSYATGVVNGKSEVGGLVGINFRATITNSYATGVVNGVDSVGGLVGENYGAIEKCYARGRVTGSSHVGALVGFNYDIEPVSDSDSFYEKDANPWLYGVGNESDEPGYVTGLSTSDMKLEANFNTSTVANGSVNPQWDFTPDTGVWKIDPAKNGGYPYLAWQMLTPLITSVPYTLSDLTVTYKGSAYLLSDQWSATTLFGGSYNSWTAGTDYCFLDDGSPVTGFTNVGSYATLSINVIKEGYAVAATGNTTGSLTIGPAHLTVTADNQSRFYGASNPLFTETITGFANGETSGVVSGTATGSSTATETTGVGTAVITGSIAGLSAGNYDFSAANGVLTITPDTRDRPVIPEPSEGDDPFHEPSVTPPDQVVTEGALLGGEGSTGILVELVNPQSGSVTK